MTMVEKLSLQDKQDLIDLIDLVFSQAHCPHNFKELIPKLYGESVDTMPYHYAVRENGKLMAAVLRYPISFQIGDNILKTAGIGSVCSHMLARQKGYMKEIMNAIDEDFKHQEFDLAWLGGQRQRYQYFGFERCVGQYRVFLNDINLRHAKGRDYQPEYTFMAFAECPVDWIDRAYQIHNHQEIHALRAREDFEMILHTWQQQPFIILKEDQIVGYLTSDAQKTKIGECVLLDNCIFAEVLFSFLKTYELKQLEITIGILETEKIKQMVAVCEKYQKEFRHNFRILHFQKVLQACLACKAQHMALPDGAIVTGIEDEVLQITLTNNQVSVTLSQQPPQIVLTKLQAHLFFFGLSAPQELFLQAAEYPFLNSWLPLDLKFSEQDAV